MVLWVMPYFFNAKDQQIVETLGKSPAIYTKVPFHSYISTDVCSRSISNRSMVDPLQLENYYIDWVKTSCTANSIYYVVPYNLEHFYQEHCPRGPDPFLNSFKIIYIKLIMINVQKIVLCKCTILLLSFYPSMQLQIPPPSRPQHFERKNILH